MSFLSAPAGAAGLWAAAGAVPRAAAGAALRGHARADRGVPGAVPRVPAAPEPGTAAQGCTRHTGPRKGHARSPHLPEDKEGGKAHRYLVNTLFL